MKSFKNIDLELGELVLIWQLLVTERKRMDEKIEGQVIPLESHYEKRDEVTQLYKKINSTISELMDQ